MALTSVTRDAAASIRAGDPPAGLALPDGEREDEHEGEAIRVERWELELA